MKVWVVEPTDRYCYGISGIFDSLEAAKKSMPKIVWVQDKEGNWGDAKGSYWIYEDQVQTLESIRADAGFWVLTWFDVKTDEFVRELRLTDEMRYGEIKLEVPDGQECFIGFRSGR